MLNENTFAKNICFSLWDQDISSLEYVKMNMPKTSRNIDFNFENTKILNMLGLEQSMNGLRMEKQDLIYSLGVVDYFRNNVFERFVSYFYNLLNPGGQLIIACCGTQYPWNYLLLTWFSDWHFYLRDASVVKTLGSSLNMLDVRLHWKKNGNFFFIIINKSS